MMMMMVMAIIIVIIIVVVVVVCDYSPPPPDGVFRIALFSPSPISWRHRALRYSLFPERAALPAASALVLN